VDVAVIGLLAVLAIAGVHAASARLGVAAPLLLVAVGVVVSLLPFVPAIEVDPEWVLMGVLPPLLYSASVSMPAMDFRRDFSTIGSLSVVLVVISSVLVGLFISAVVPGVGLATGIALGAIISPTDAVATSIVKRLGAPPRIVTVLEGESLLNDATALVLLRSAIAATSVSVSLWGVVGDFAYAVAIAVVAGLLVGRVNLMVRARVSDPAVSTAISFAVPFVAYLPVEHLGGSGLVAAVAAGLVTGHSAPRYLEPGHRRSEEQNWRTIELLLEGGVFLLMGLELYGLVEDLDEVGGGVGTALWVGGVSAAIVVAVRTAYVVPLLVGLHRRARRGEATRERIAVMQERIEAPGFGVGPRGDQPVGARRMEMFRTRMRRGLADIDYLAGSPVGWREGTVLVWAGMRGVVTLAAAQTLPADTPERSLLILVAFVVAVGTLVVQGGTLPLVVRRLGLVSGSGSEPDPDREPLMRELAAAAERLMSDPALVRPDGTPYDESVLARNRSRMQQPLASEDAPDDAMEQYRDLWLATLATMREALLRARSDGTYSSDTLEHALAVLDSEQISTELRARHLD
jgi:CPA1 family monovalent cation:H+ antiporter